MPLSEGHTNTSGSFGCSFPDGPASSIVSAQATDSDNDAGNTDTQTVTVNNVAPTVTLSATNDLSVDEGTTHTYSYTVSDPGQDTFTVNSGYPSCGTGGQLVSGSATTTATGGSFQCFFPDGPATTSVAIKVTDSDGASDTDSESVQVVQVANVNPTITPAGAQSSNEGENHSFSLGSFSDPGPDSPWDVSVDWGDSSSPTAFQVTGSGAASNLTLGSKSHVYADGPNDYTVAITVTDKNGGADTKSFSVHVNNVAPTVAFTAAPSSANEGQTKTYTYSISDPGQDTITSVATSCGVNGTKSNASSTNTSGSFDCTFPDGPASSTVTVQATDSDDAAGNTASQLVSIANVAPTVTLSASNDLSVNEGTSHTYSYTISDPGQDTVQGVAVSCGANGTLVPLSESHTNTSGSFGCSFPDGPASSIVSVQATDSDNAAGNTATQTVTVNNVAPTVTFSATNDTSVTEGTTHTYNYTVTDPGQDTFTVDAGYPKCGSFGNLVGTPTTTASGGSFQCNFPDGPNSTTLGIKVTDSDGASDTDSEAVQVVAIANVAPSVTAAADQSSDEGESHSFSLGSFSDPGADNPWHVTVAWGDGSPVTTFDAATTGPLGTKPHTYVDGPNNYTVTVSVNDGTDTTNNTFLVHVNNVNPTIAISGAANVNEGSVYTLTLGAVTDPGTDTVSSYVVHWGDGSSDTYTTNGAKTHTYADGPNNYAAKVDLVDEDGTFTDRANALSVHVDNVNPTVTLAAANTYAFDESGTAERSFGYSVSDPAGANDPITIDSVSCGAAPNVVASNSSTRAPTRARSSASSRTGPTRLRSRSTSATATGARARRRMRSRSTTSLRRRRSRPRTTRVCRKARPTPTPTRSPIQVRTRSPSAGRPTRTAVPAATWSFLR